MSNPITYTGDPLAFSGDPLVWGGVSLPTGLGPLINSYEAGDVEAELKAAFMQVFEGYLRQGLARVDTYGMPHVGDFVTIERFVKADGLALERRESAEPYMRELFRGWRARNPRRGLHFLRYYLRLLWPGRWRLAQLWQHPDLPYPDGASENFTPGSFLTSRVRLFLELEGDTNGTELARLIGSFRSALPARMVLKASILTEAEGALRVALVAESAEYETWTVTAST